MQLNEFMYKNFRNLELKPPLFYSWPTGIRFELGAEGNYPDNLYAQGCYKRAITLFEALHSPTDEIFAVIDVNDFRKGKNLKQQLKNFPPYVKKSLLFKLEYQDLPYIFPEDDEEGVFKTHRFTLQCKTSDVKYVPLLKAICNKELGRRPRIFHRVYFVNITKKTIFHVYDDRGCDLLATSPDAIKFIYQKYDHWILDYDKPAIDRVFNEKI